MQCNGLMRQLFTSEQEITELANQADKILILPAILARFVLDPSDIGLTYDSQSGGAS